MPILNKRPLRISAGDTVVFNDPDPNYPAEDYTLHFVIQCLPAVVNVEADEDHQVTLTSEVTDPITPGIYACFYRFEDEDGNFVTHPLGNILILAKATAALVLTQTQTDLNLALATRRSLIAKTVQSGTVNGEVYSLQNLTALNNLISTLRAEVNSELARMGRKPLSGGKKTIQAYF